VQPPNFADRNSVCQTHRKERVHEADLQMGAEDFSFMALAKPAAFFYLGAKMDDVNRQHHAANFDIDERVIPTGAALLAEAARKYLQEVEEK